MLRCKNGIIKIEGVINMDDQYNITLNSELATKAQSILNDYGINVNKVVNDYLEKIVKVGYQPEKTTKKEPELTLSEIRKILKGKLWTSDDFDEPLDDLKEYME